MKNEKVFVLVKDEPEYVRFEILGVFSEEGKLNKLKDFAEKEKTLNKIFISDSANAIETFKQKRAEIAYNDTKLLENAGRNLTTSEIHMHEKNLREIDALTQQIARFNEYCEQLSNCSDGELTERYMTRNHLLIQEFKVK